MKVLTIHEPKVPAAPIVLSIPHCGSHIPEELLPEFDPKMVSFIDDTDWFVDRLYGFAKEMDIPVLAANISRWVIDLNRDPSGKPLYADGRVITGLCPVTDFHGTPIYANARQQVEHIETEARIEKYFRPYHLEIRRLTDQVFDHFGRVLLWDCHSIRRSVPAIHPIPFPDLIVGDADGTSASPGISELVLRSLEESDYSVAHNHPFKGGWITRHYARPAENRHALQLEMAKVNYMDDLERSWNEERAYRMQQQLMRTFERLIASLTDR